MLLAICMHTTDGHVCRRSMALADTVEISSVRVRICIMETGLPKVEMNVVSVPWMRKDRCGMVGYLYHGK